MKDERFTYEEIGAIFNHVQKCTEDELFVKKHVGVHIAALELFFIDDIDVKSSVFLKNLENLKKIEIMNAFGLAPHDDYSYKFYREQRKNFKKIILEHYYFIHGYYFKAEDVEELIGRKTI